MLRRSAAFVCTLALIGLIGCSSNFSIKGPAEVTITLSTPTKASLLPGETEQFTATVSNTPNSNVIWEVNGAVGGNSQVGTITASGLYTAPATVSATVKVTITAAAAGNTSATAKVEITLLAPPGVSVSPAAASVFVGGTKQFAATVTNATNTAVTWLVNGVTGGNSTVGSINSSGLYTAPSSVPSGSNIVTIGAVSAADSQSVGTATVTILPLPPAVTVTPSSASVPGNTTQQFTATVTNTTNTAVTWEVNDVPGGNSTVGTITQTGLYTAPAAIPNPATVTVSAVSQADTTAVGSATVTVTTPEVVVVTPANVTVDLDATKQFTGTSSIPNDTLTWKVNDVTGGDTTYGTIDSTGLYTAPGTTPSNPVVVIKAVSGINPAIFGTAIVSIGTTAPSVTVTPKTASVIINTTQDFSATVKPSNLSQSVTWQVNSVPGGDSTDGTISSSGTYTAPLVIPSSTVTISAVSTALSGLFGTATVTVTLPSTPISVGVSPATATVIVGQSQQFTATVSPNNNPNVTWTVSSTTFGCVASSSNACGSIDSTGNYTAPTSIPGGGQSADVDVIATSVADPTKKSQPAVVTIHPVPTPTISIDATSTMVCSVDSAAGCSPTQSPTLTAVTQNFPANAQLQFNWALGCINADEDSDGCLDGTDGDSGTPDEDGPGQIEASGSSTAGTTVSNSPSILYLPPDRVYINVTTNNGCTAAGTNSTNMNWAYVPITVSTVYNGTTYTSQPTCMEVIYQF